MRKKFKIVVGFFLAFGLFLNSYSDKDTITEHTTPVINILGEDDTIGGKH